MLIVHIRLVRLHELRPTPRGVELVPTLPLRILDIRDELPDPLFQSIRLFKQLGANIVVLILGRLGHTIWKDIDLHAGILRSCLQPGLMIRNVFNKLLPHLLQLLQTSRIGIQRRIHRVGMSLHSAGIVIRLVH